MEMDLNLSNKGWDCGISAGIRKKQFTGKWD